MDSLTKERLETHIREKMFETSTPALTIAIRGQKEGNYDNAFGYSDVASGRKAETRTCFGIGSLTKSFTAICVLRLYFDGKLDLADSITKYIQEIRGTVFDRVTLHHLLSHSSGVSTLGTAETMLMNRIKGSWGTDKSRDEIFYGALRQAGDWLVGAPGERFSYLNEGFSLLHDVVERVSGSSYEQFVEQNVFDPIGMKDTFFLNNASDAEAHDIATPYSAISSRVPVPTPLLGGTPGSGSIFSNVIDLSKYMEMLVNRGSIGRRKIIDSSGIDMMESVHTKISGEEIGPEGCREVKGAGYGYGLNVSSDFFGRKLVSHGGSVFVYTAYMGFVRESGESVAILSNTTGVQLGNLGKYALAVAMGMDPRELVTYRNLEAMKLLAGTYETLGGSIRLDIRAAGERLEMRNNYSTDATVLFPEVINTAHSRFFTLSGFQKVYADFVPKGEGRVDLIFSNSKYRKKTS